jgi:hypothetical protein
MGKLTTSRGAVLLVMLAGVGAFAQQRHGPMRAPTGARQAALPQRAYGPAMRQGMRPGGAPVMRGAPLQAELGAGSQMQQRPAPVERRPPPSAGERAGGNSPKAGEHLPEWMNQHRNLSPAQQQQALVNEAGFRELPPKTQQRLLNRLAQLNAMPAEQRSRTIARTEWMERLPPEQRGQVRSAMQQLGSLPPNQRQFVARSFRQLRELPPGQRVAAMNSYAYQSQMNDAQRATLNNLMRIEPMLPPDEKPAP